MVVDVGASSVVVVVVGASVGEAFSVDVGVGSGNHSMIWFAAGFGRGMPMVVEMVPQATSSMRVLDWSNSEAALLLARLSDVEYVRSGDSELVGAVLEVTRK